MSLMESSRNINTVLTEKSSTALCPLFFFHDGEHVARTRLEMRQVERLLVEPSQNRHERDSGLANQRVFVIFEFKNLKMEVSINYE